MARFSALIIFLLWNCSLQGQVIKPNEYTLNPDAEPLTFSKRLLNEMGGEGFKMNPKFKLKHAFYGDMPGNPFRNIGTWNIKNDSVIFIIKPSTLTRKYGYKSQERYYLVTASYQLLDELNSYSIINQIVILNDGTLPANFLSEMNSIITEYMNEIDKEEIWLIDERVDNINQRLTNYLAELEIFISIEPERKTITNKR